MFINFGFESYCGLNLMNRSIAQEGIVCQVVVVGKTVGLVEGMILFVDDSLDFVVAESTVLVGFVKIHVVHVKIVVADQDLDNVCWYSYIDILMNVWRFVCYFEISYWTDCGVDWDSLIE